MAWRLAQPAASSQQPSASSSRYVDPDSVCGDGNSNPLMQLNLQTCEQRFVDLVDAHGKRVAGLRAELAGRRPVLKTILMKRTGCLS
jgi:hypothetical protein